jgi:hypothetical protein
MPEISDKTEATLHNSAVLIGPEGLIGKYQKMYLPTHSIFEEKRYFRPGYQTAVFDTKLGKLGFIICYDIYFPEVTRLARLKGAQLIVCISASPGVRRTFFEALTVARAIENTTFLAFVNLVGIEDGLQFWGGSRLIGPQGRIIAKAKYDDEDQVTGNVNYADIRSVETFVPTLRDLRPELFDKLKEDAEKLVRFCRFAPEGRRSAAPPVRAAKYGFTPFPEFLKKQNKENMVIPIIEEKEALQDLNKIIEVKGIDVLFYGPFDLSMTMGFGTSRPG